MSETTFSLRVLKINDVIFDGEALSITAPGTSGELTILAKHETMLASLQPGEVIVRPRKGEELCIDIEHGFIEANGGNVTVLL